MTDLNAAVGQFLESVRERIPDPEEFAAYCDALHRDMTLGLQRGKEPPRLLTEGERLRIRTACLDDEPFMRMVELEDDNRRWVGHWPLPWRIARFGDPDFLQCMIERTDGSPVGILIFCDMTRTEEKLQLKRIALLEKGQGLGREALKLAQAWAFDVIGTPTLYLGTKPDNHRAQHVYLSTGFRAATPLPCAFFYMHREDREAGNA
ncbi:MAG: GNAT family N-acetyltransferase [Clostridia bacterium]|nr:GNAT family N-acetyltransferase [Clostridia bacterium]